MLDVAMFRARFQHLVVVARQALWQGQRRASSQRYSHAAAVQAHGLGIGIIIQAATWNRPLSGLKECPIWWHPLD